MSELHIETNPLIFFCFDSTGNMWQCLYWLFLAFLSTGSTLADPLYRWQDAKSNTHYSDHPPPGDAQVLHPDTGHEPTSEELEAAKAKKLAKEAEALKKEAQPKQETANQSLVIIPVPMIQPVPEIYTPYWGPIYPYRRQPFYPQSSSWHSHPRKKTGKPASRRTRPYHHQDSRASPPLR